MVVPGVWAATGDVANNNAIRDTRFMLKSPASAVMVAASHPLHVFNNTPAPIGFSHCQKLIGTPFS